MLYITINMASSIDGKIATKFRGPVKLGSEYDSQRMDEIRAEQDLVINGASTFHAHPFPLSVKDPALLAQRQINGLSVQPISAIVSSRLELPKGTAFEKASTIERWIFCGAKAPARAIETWEKAGVKVLLSRADRPSAKEIIRQFEKYGLRRVLIEGGGELNATFLEAGLVDRIHLTLCPILVGGSDAPTIFEGKGFKTGRFPKFRLAEHRLVGDELYLTYERA